VSQANPGMGPTTSNGTAAGGRSPTGGRRPFGAVVSSVFDGVRSLIRKEIELAKLELTEAAAVRAKGVGLMAAAGVVGVFALVFIAASGSAALDLVLPEWAAHLIVAGVFLLLAMALVLAGRRALRTAPTPTKTQETLKEDARWAKQQIAR
jgi:hypothetical protein